MGNKGNFGRSSRVTRKPARRESKKVLLFPTMKPMGKKDEAEEEAKSEEKA